MILLIDNCSLLQLVNSQGYGKFLLDLTDHINNGNITLITHELLIEEWDKHKLKDKTRKEKILRKKLGTTDDAAQGTTQALERIDVIHLDKQIAQIDELLKKAEVLRTPQVITNEFSDRYRRRLAPFHKKLDGQNDWEIIGTACIYCEQYNRAQLYFISSNYSDFADPGQPLNKIHDDLQGRFQKVKINYFQLFADFFQELNFSIDRHNLIPGNITKNEKFSFKSSMKKNVLDSLYYLFHDLYAEISFIPVHLLKNYYPFRESENIHPYYSLFALYEINSKLITLFEQIKIDTTHNDYKIVNHAYFNGVENHKEKLDFVLQKLTNNLIFNLEGNLRDNFSRVKVYYAKQEFCTCAKCSYSRFDFMSVLKRLEVAPKNLDEKFKHAYIQYQLKNYKATYNLLLEIRDEAYVSKKYIQYFISQHNLSHLGVFLSSPFYGRMMSDQDKKSLKLIDPIEECVKLKSLTDYDLLHYIAKGDFFSWAFQDISNATEQIVQHYRSQLLGGWSSNNFVWKLIESFTNLEFFIGNNFIMYEHYSNFDELFNFVTKGILASHAMNLEQEGAYREFDNTWIKKFIFYGSTKTILKYFGKFELRQLKYDKKSPGINFIDLAKNLLNNKRGFQKEFEKVADEDNDFLGTTLDKYVENLITMAGLIELENKDVNQFANILLRFIKANHIDHITQNAITQFVARKSSAFTQRLLTKYITLYNGSKLKGNTVLAFLLSNLTEKPAEIIIPDMVAGCLDRNKKGNEPIDYELLFQLHKMADADERISISNMINQHLESHFNMRLYHVSVISEFIPFDEKMLFKRLSKIDTTRKNPTNRLFFKEKDYRNVDLDALINICFKFNINTRTKRFQKFSEKHDYYKWLLNMDQFDYNHFDIDWPSSYRTFYYFREMAKSKNLISHFIDYMETNSNPLLQDTFVKINMHKNRPK
ncbi:PIN domain-containing protein [Pedobacter africanus]|uniref:DUF4935 domain-containing protein n=1 Tax=Pedobacter africanus TaxID=151894 RepID=A0A1W1Z7Z5_9SPHI|nr:PIN domain-containing protein [Pedobacter africanus]SMC44271.1 hypothetical protein SAMN04488524_0435 [Pedobacter africanus]